MLPLAWLLPLLWGACGGQPGVPRRSPPPGSLAQDGGYQLCAPAEVTVQEGLCTLVRCSFSFPPTARTASTPVHGHWYRKGASGPGKGPKKKDKAPFSLLGDPQANNCSLSIQDPRKEDSGDYFFHVEIGGQEHSYRENSITVTVTALTQPPHIRIPQPLQSGRPSRLQCSWPTTCARGARPTFSWSGAALGSAGRRSGPRNFPAITLTPGAQDHGTKLTCRVTLPRAGPTVESTVTLNVSYAPQNLTVGVLRGNSTEMNYLGNGSALPVLKGESLQLVCVANSNPPAELSWARGSQAPSPLQSSDLGVLELPPVQMEHEGELTCRAENLLGSDQVSLLLSVIYPPQLLSPFCSWEAEGLRCSCSARARPAPSLRWRLGEELVEGTHDNASFTATSSLAGPWAHSNLSLHEGLGPGPGLQLSCEAQNAHGHQRVTVLLLPGKEELGRGFLQGAVWGAGAAALLSLCPCLIFLTVKICRKQAARTAAGGTDVPSVTDSASPYESWLGSPPDHLPPAAATPTSAEEMELHYACLSFHGLRPREPRDLEATSTTEYTELKILQ
ncbi:sialic acid-binding Ig-like lectin 5 [Choloepus didactylus]|uniref:sialic acid-binding Ig-like lectin 5 n=1 Tax=Choloepus didactylus TaxID=27675 RepID=UPI0018A01ADB|nr:sialic acid-binding Ig-like lectin 5 [Choloepus didactylus]